MNYGSRPDFGMVHDDTHICGFFGEYRWLSNFHLCQVDFEGLRYPSSENAYQAAKIDPSLRGEFQTITPAKSKRLPKQLSDDFDQELWDRRKEEVMLAVLRSKFTLNRDVADKLIATGKKHLEETNWWGDKFWGVCKGVGQNRLGRILMQIREEISP